MSEREAETPGPERIRTEALRDGARLPRRGSALAAGADLHCLEGFVLSPGERRSVPTGIAVEIPAGYYGRVAPRSGLAVRHGIDTLAGVIDADYRGEILVLLINHGETAVEFAAGDRIAQLIIERAIPVDYHWAERLGETERGTGGFGSTGQ
jgi:deoxyuridine 5'-triphosphate nucleotidohydrolase